MTVKRLSDLLISLAAPAIAVVGFFSQLFERATSSASESDLGTGSSRQVQTGEDPDLPSVDVLQTEPGGTVQDLNFNPAGAPLAPSKLHASDAATERHALQLSEDVSVEAQKPPQLDQQIELRTTDGVTVWEASSNKLTITHVNGIQIFDGGPAIAVENGEVRLLDGKLHFTPEPDYVGKVFYTYTISDGQHSSTATVHGYVRPVNDAPIAVNDAYSVDEDGVVTIDVLGNDRDADGDSLRVTHVNGQVISEGGPAVAVTNGSVTLASGKLVFTAAPDANGSANFSYTLSDGTVSTVAQVKGTITTVNDAPVAVNDTFPVDEDGTVAVDVLANDRDVDGDSLRVTHVNGQTIVKAVPRLR